MVSVKVRRSSGRVEARLTIPAKLAIQESIDPVSFWDDWVDFRDGFRFGKVREEKLTRPKKVKKAIAVRKARK